MLFSSITFLYYFLPIVLFLHCVVPKWLKNGVLLLSSLVFYAWGGPKYLLLIGTSILLGYFFGLLVEKCAYKKRAKLCITVYCVVVLGFLAYFKYAGFFIANINGLMGTDLPLLKIVLPLGISFYTFHMLSYVVDIYRGDVKAQRNLVDFATYVMLFPQLVAGPIVRYVGVAKELTSRSITVDEVFLGARRFLFGLAKKVLIANMLGELCDAFLASQAKSVLFYWLYAVAFTMQIYFDFSGYSDMALGLGRMFGFHLLENFNYPYTSRSITEFWRRWHISLSSWFRDYVYIPLGGNRVKKPRWLFNLAVVWMLTGLWHGAAWNFVLWGVLFAVLLMAEKFWLAGVLEKLPRLATHFYVMFFVVLSFVLFNASGLKAAAVDIGAMFGMGGLPFANAETLYYLQSYAMLLAAAIVGCTPLCKTAVSHCCEKTIGARLLRVAEPTVLVVLLVTVTAYLVDGSFNPFLYFRF